MPLPRLVETNRTDASNQMADWAEDDGGSIHISSSMALHRGWKITVVIEPGVMRTPHRSTVCDKCGVSIDDQTLYETRSGSVACRNCNTILTSRVKTEASVQNGKLHIESYVSDCFTPGSVPSGAAILPRPAVKLVHKISESARDKASASEDPKSAKRRSKPAGASSHEGDRIKTLIARGTRFLQQLVEQISSKVRVEEQALSKAVEWWNRMCTDDKSRTPEPHCAVLLYVAMLLCHQPLLPHRYLDLVLPENPGKKEPLQPEKCKTAWSNIQEFLAKHPDIRVVPDLVRLTTALIERLTAEHIDAERQEQVRQNALKWKDRLVECNYFADPTASASKRSVQTYMGIVAKGPEEVDETKAKPKQPVQARCQNLKLWTESWVLRALVCFELAKRNDDGCVSGEEVKSMCDTCSLGYPRLEAELRFICKIDKKGKGVVAKYPLLHKFIKDKAPGKSTKRVRRNRNKPVAKRQKINDSDEDRQRTRSLLVPAPRKQQLWIGPPLGSASLAPAPAAEAAVPCETDAD